MLERLRQKPGAERIEAGRDMRDASRRRVLAVYLVFNTIFNLTSQDGQVALENAAAHLALRAGS